MTILDVFNSDAFSVMALTRPLLDQVYLPGKIGAMGLFNEEPTASTVVGFERLGDTAVLVPVSPRGGVPPTMPRDRRSLVHVAAPRIAVQDAVYADEVQNLRAFGTESQTETVVNLTNQRNSKMARAVAVTLEYHRLTAIKGAVLDSDGVSVLLDIYALLGQTQQTEIDMDLDNASPASGAMRKAFGRIIRNIEEELGGLMYTGIHGFAGKNFMDDLIAHPEYTASYQAADAARLRDRGVGISVSYGGITVEEYRGKVGGVQFVGDDKAIFFPLGVPGLFQTFYAPADYEETVNTPGLPLYAKTAPDSSGFDRYRQLEVQSNPINYCSRPRTVQFARRT